MVFRKGLGLVRAGLALALLSLLQACTAYDTLPTGTLGPVDGSPPADASEYVIGPLDTLNIFVWRNPDVSLSIPVRPDGKISTPLIEDMQAANKTPTQLARDIEKALSKYIQDPIVTVMVSNFNGPPSRQIRVVGEATKPQAIAYRDNMTLLDVMVEVGGLTEFAAGNRASLLRIESGEQKQYSVRLADLIKKGDASANAPVKPGDVLIIPESWF